MFRIDRRGIGRGGCNVRYASANRRDLLITPLLAAIPPRFLGDRGSKPKRSDVKTLLV
jgi:hypothetical protein